MSYIWIFLGNRVRGSAPSAAILRPAGAFDLLCRPGHEESLPCSWGPKVCCTLAQKHDGTIGGTQREGIAFRDRDRSSHRACLGSAHRLRSLSRVEPFYTSSKRASGGLRAPRGTHATLRHKGNDLSPHRDEGRTRPRTALAWAPAGAGY